MNEDLNVLIFNGEEDFDELDEVKKESSDLLVGEFNFAVKE